MADQEAIVPAPIAVHLHMFIVLMKPQALSDFAACLLTFSCRAPHTVTADVFSLCLLLQGYNPVLVGVSLQLVDLLWGIVVGTTPFPDWR